VDAGNADLDNVNGVWQQLVEDFPFLARTVTGTARDLGPYERPGNPATGVSPTTEMKMPGVRKYVKDRRLVIEKDGLRYNALGQKQ
jgi:hypothetical protein